VQAYSRIAELARQIGDDRALREAERGQRDWEAIGAGIDMAAMILPKLQSFHEFPALIAGVGPERARLLTVPDLDIAALPSQAIVDSVRRQLQQMNANRAAVVVAAYDLGSEGDATRFGEADARLLQVFVVDDETTAYSGHVGDTPSGLQFTEWQTFTPIRTHRGPTYPAHVIAAERALSE
jgi:hypothetical protein